MSAPLSRDLALSHGGNAETIRPGRLWSLWDMLEQNAGQFLELVQAIKAIELILQYEIVSNKSTKDAIIASHLRDGLFNSCSKVVLLCGQMSLLVTEISAKRLSRWFAINQSPTYRDALDAVTDINTRLGDELDAKVFLSLSDEEMKFYSPNTSLFGAEFDTGFRELGAFELDEAVKCLAFGRPNASVFHLMRLMEIGIRAIARCLQIPDPVKPAERNWGRILEKVQGGIDVKWPAAADRMAGDGQLFKSLYVSLDAVKNPWRNATMHVENKYTDDEAQHIYAAVRGFFKKLASRCDENGLPLA